LKVVAAEKVTVELLTLPVEIVPSLVRVVILDRVEVNGKVKVAPELLVKVVGLKDKVPVLGKVMFPELVTVVVVMVEAAEDIFIVPELERVVPDIDRAEVEEKFIVLPELLVNVPTLVIAVRDGKVSVVALLRLWFQH